MKQFLLIMVVATCSLLSQAQAPTINANFGLPITSAKGVAYGNSVYVTLVNNKVYTSADGNNWSRVTDASVPTGTFNSLSFGTGLFVAAGNNGLLFTSTNGINWTTRTSGTANHLYDVQFLNSSFYAVGNNATLLTSSNGTSWSVVTMGTGLADDMFMNITYGNSLYVIGVREQSTGNLIIYRSATGLSNSWTKQNLGFASLNKVQYLKDRFYIFTSGTDVYTSANGSTWTNSTASMILTLPNATTQNIGSPNQAFHGIYDGSKIYLFGYAGYYSSYGSIFSSTDGINFTLEPKTAYIVAQGSAYINNKYFQYGNEGVVASTNGTVYKYPGGNYYSVASSGTAYVGVGMIGAAGIIFHSTDFNSWSERTPSVINELYAVVYNGSKFVAAGEGIVLESADNGLNWSAIATPGDVITGMTYGASQYVAAGYDINSYAAKIMYSSDAINWTTANSADNYYFRVKYENGNYFALGYDNASYTGVIMHSANGITWTNITPDLPYDVAYFSDVVHDGSKYHFMGVEFADLGTYTYDDFFSVSTSTLSNPNSFINKGSITTAPGGAQLGGMWGEGVFTFNNGHFAGSLVDINTNEAYAVYSDNGTSWTAVALNETGAAMGLVNEGTTFRFLGTSDAKITMSYSTGTLPVTFLRFTGMLRNNQSELQWETANEINAKDFVVEHSITGRNWSAIGTVAASGNSSSTQQYRFTHTTPAGGINYYRLQQRDDNGQSAYSKTISLVNNNHSKLLIYPNPVTNGILNLQTQQAGSISLYNSSGALVLKQLVTAGSQQINVSNLPAGIYTLRSEWETLKIFIR
ncbi:MAG: T9SS type A sorting domain-containing protein [Lacibacter sp.]